jgi:hypothetical protein
MGENHPVLSGITDKSNYFENLTFLNIITNKCKKN